jgi:ADP-ribose pyrophosphatase YjhB (NUDIX family)
MQPVRVRVSVKAIIIQDGHLLLVRSRDRQGDWYLLPGGGQHPGESLPAALRRECREEIGVDVEVGGLRFVRDYIGRNHEYADEDAGMHQVELMFACRLAPGARPRVGPVPDSQQTGVAWIPLEAIGRHRVYPRQLAAVLRDATGGPVYLGDVN